MRIVLVTPDLNGRSGWSRYSLDLGKALVAHGHEVHAVVSRQSGADWCTEHALLRQPTSYLESGLLRRYHAFIVNRILRKLQPDIVHFIAEPYALMLPLMHAHPWKSVLTIHGTYATVPLQINPSSRTLAEEYYRQMDGIVAVSHFTKRHLCEREPALCERAQLEERITVIHNAIDLEGIAARTGDSPSDILSVISVSAIKRKKGLLQAVEAVAAFLRAHPIHLHYDIIGSPDSDPAFTAELQAKIHALGLGKTVTLRGSLTDQELGSAYRSADLFLMPSLQEGDYFEGFGLVFLEANARGTPVIGSTTGGCPEAIDHGYSGYVCDPENIDAIAARMADVLIGKTIKRPDCRLWAEKHDSDTTVESIERLYQSL